MYYTGMHPLTREKVYVAKSFEEKLAQRALMQFSYPKNYDIVYQALMKAGREDLIGYKQTCLIPPYKKNPGQGTNYRKPATTGSKPSYGKPAASHGKPASSKPAVGPKKSGTNSRFEERRKPAGNSRPSRGKQR